MIRRSNGPADTGDNDIERKGGKGPGRPLFRARRRATATSHSELGERLIAGVPARIMRPRLVFIACLVAICLFGLLMVYSASSVESLKELGSSYYYLIRQGIFMAVGAAVLLLITGRVIPLPTWGMFRSLAPMAWWAILALLVVVLLIGTGGDTWGASRWIPLGFFNLQPAELAKPVVIMVMADLFASYYDERTVDTATFLFKSALFLAVPAVLIMAEPDLGTTVIILAAVFAMAILCGISWRLVIGLVAVLVIAFVVAVAMAPYRLNRFFIALNPWSDPYGLGFQSTLAIMAFASGGLFGRGIGNSTIKYNYLPEAHNDYILAIIGEELGFVGTLMFIAVFLLMVYAAFKIAMRAPSLHAQLLACGCALVLAIQFFINVLGILGVLPMTGKPLPFVSYGGSSVLTSMILAGIIIRVSLESNVETAHDRRRSGMAVMRLGGSSPAADDVSSHMGRSTAGEARARSARSGRGSSRRASGSREDGAARLSVMDGGRSERRDRPSRSHRPRSAEGVAGGYDRIDLQPGGAERLRTRGVRTRIDYDDVARPSGPRRSGDGGRSQGRNRHDR